VSEYLPFLVAGLVTGAIYALASMGLVLTYTTSGVFNFAHGAVAMFATYLFYSLRVDAGVPTALAAVLTVLLIAPAMGLVIDRLLFRRLEGAGSGASIVASLGLLVALQGLAVVIYGGDLRPVAGLFPRDTYRLPGVNVGVDQTVVVAVAIGAAAGLAFFFRRTHLGLQTRAVVGDRDLTELVGANAGWVTSLSWMLGCSFAAMSGILFAPFIGLDSLFLTLLVVQAFGAAVVGRLRSLPLTNLGAYGVGIGAALSTKLAASHPGLSGLPSAVPFIVLFLVLLVSPKGRFVEAAKDAGLRIGATRRAASIRPALPWPALGATTVAALFLPAVLNGSQLLTATTTLAFVLIFASLSLVVGLSRQVSLCHTVFVVFGATTLSHFLDAGVPYLLALPLAALVLVPVGALLAIPAIRLSGLFLALATFGFAVLAQNLLFPTAIAFGQDAIARVPRPGAVDGDTAFYYMVLAVVVVGVLVVEVIRVSRLGRFLRALADSTTAVESIGVNPTASRVIVFCVSAFLAAVAGGLLGSLVQSVNPASFDSFQSLIWLTVLVAGGVGTFGGSVLAALMLVTAPAVFTSPTFVEWQPVLFGVAAIILAQTGNGLAGVLFRRPDFAALARGSGWRINRRRAADRYVATVYGAARSQ
jgi:branched-subunit amino acid ABC-type transport system permease component